METDTYDKNKQRLVFMKQAQSNVKRDQEYAKIYYYDMGAGRILSSTQVRQLYVNARGLAARTELTNAIKSSIKSEVILTKITNPFGGNNTKRSGFSSETVANLINNKYSDKIQPKAGIRVALEPVRIPKLREYALTLPMKRESESFKEMLTDFKEMGLPLKVIVAKDSKEKDITYKTRNKEGVLVVMAYVRIKFEFPIPDFASNDRLTPVYTFTFSSIPYWKDFMLYFHKKLINGKMGDEEETKDAIELYNAMDVFVKEHFFGNGTLDGMLSRIKVMAKARANYKSNRTKRTIKDHEAFVRTLIYFLPVRPFKGVSLNTPDIEKILEQEIMITVNGIEDVRSINRKVNSTSNPGPWYSNRRIDPTDPRSRKMKRADTAFIEPLLCTTMMADLYKPIMPIHPEKGKKYYDLKAFMEKWASIRLFNLFPKGEVYEEEKRFTKTRCIASYNSAPMIPVQVLMQPIIDSLEDALTKPVIFRANARSMQPRARGSLVLTKLSVYKGTVTRIMNLITNAFSWNPGDFWAGVYADNLYLILRYQDRVKWISLDGEKAESAIMKSTISDALQALCQINDKSGAEIDSPYREYFTNIFPYVATEGVGLIGNQQILYPAMGSGVMGTFFFNTVKMIELLTHYTENNVLLPISKDNKISDSFKKTMKSVGYHLTREYSEDFFNDAKMDRQDLLMDLLGYNFSLFTIDSELDIYFSVLRESSLFGLTLFRKEHYDDEGKTKLSTTEENYLMYLRCRTAILVGAWHEPPLYRLLLSKCTSYHNKLRNSVDEAKITLFTEEELKFYLFGESEDIFGLESLLSVILKPAIPTIYEIVMLQTNDKELSIRAVKHRIGLVPYLYLAPISILQELGIDEDTVLEEIEIEGKPLVKLYPHLKSGAVAYMTSPSVKAQTKPLGGKRLEIQTIDQKELAARKVVTKDVGRHKISKPLPEYSERNETRYKASTNWLIALGKKGKIYYRVPIPLIYIGRESEIRNEGNVAFKAVVSALVNATGFPKQEIVPLMKLAPNVTWTVKAVKELPIGFNFNSEFEVTDRPLEPHKVINRSYQVI